MAETRTSQPQQSTPANGKANPFGLPFSMPSFDPSAFTMSGVAELWRKAAAEQQTRLASLFEEYAKAEEKGVAEVRRAIDEMARLSHATVDYAREQGANFRQAVIELSKKAAGAVPADQSKA